MDYLKNQSLHFLEWSQKYTKVDMRYLANSGFWLGLQQAITILAAFAMSVVLANFMSKSDYGVYRFFLSIFAIFLVFSLPGISIATITGVANKTLGRIRNMFRLQVKWGLVGSLVALGMSAYYFINDNNTLSLIFLLAVPLVPFFDSFLLYESWLRGKKRFKQISLYRSSTQIVFTVLFSILVIFIFDNIVYIIASYLLIFFLMRMFFFTHIFKDEIRNAPTDKAVTYEEEDLIKYGKHLSVMNGLSFIAIAVDKVIIFHFLGSASLAVYAFALSLPDQVKAALKQLISVALPKYAERDYAEIKRTVLFRLGMISAVTSVIALVYILLAPYVYGFFFPQYGESILYTQIIILTIVPNAGIFFMRTIFNAKKRTKEQYVFSIVYPLTQITFFFVGYFALGLLGVVIAFVCAQAVGLLYMLGLMFYGERLV